MTSIKAFETEKELQSYTGLSHEELLEVGFDLDDIDIIFVTDEKIDDYNLWWLYAKMYEAIGVNGLFFNHEFYYTIHHA